MSATHSDKVPVAHAFLDISDYARPAARWLVARLAGTPVTAIHVTLAFTIFGLAAAGLLALGRHLWLAGVLLLIKSGLDAADGALARARGRPSRIGRFLDSICDFVVNVAVFGAIAWNLWQRTGQGAAWLFAALALLSALLQVTLYNYFYVRYRFQTGGDQTSHIEESSPAGYLWDNPFQVTVLHGLYRGIYGWQDAFVQRLAGLVAPGATQLDSRFMAAASVLGLGTQLLVIAVCAALGRPEWALWLFLIVFNGYAVALLLSRRQYAT